MNINLDLLVGRICHTNMTKTRYQIVGYYMIEGDHRPRLTLLGSDGKMIPVILYDVTLIGDNPALATVS